MNGCSNHVKINLKVNLFLNDLLSIDAVARAPGGFKELYYLSLVQHKLSKITSDIILGFQFFFYFNNSKQFDILVHHVID